MRSAGCWDNIADPSDGTEGGCCFDTIQRILCKQKSTHDTEFRGRGDQGSYRPGNTVHDLDVLREASIPNDYVPNVSIGTAGVGNHDGGCAILSRIQVGQLSGAACQAINRVDIILSCDVNRVAKNINVISVSD